MNSEWSFSSRLFKGSVALLTMSNLFTILSFFTPYWLQSYPTQKNPRPKFTNLGLWHACFDGFHDKGHQYETKFYGCRHILLEEYDIIRTELVKPFFIATQFFFTISFVGMLVAGALVMMYLLCIDEFFKVWFLRWSGFDLIISGICWTMALILFGAQGDGRDFMPDWEQNYLSWSFGLGFVGVFLMYVVAILFIVEARIIARKEIAREIQYPMEKAV